MWDESRNAHLFTRGILEKAQFLIDAIAEFDLQMTLLAGIPTLCALATGNDTWPDNILYLASSLPTLYAATRYQASGRREHTTSQ